MNSELTRQGLPPIEPGATQWKGANGPRVDPSRLVGYTNGPAVAADAVHEEVGDGPRMRNAAVWIECYTTCHGLTSRIRSGVAANAGQWR